MINNLEDFIRKKSIEAGFDDIGFTKPTINPQDIDNYLKWVDKGYYADMDYMCFKNFYNILPKNKISISESPYKENEEIQNALMISPPNNSFWLEVIKLAEKRKHSNNILYSTGPRLLSDVYLQKKKKVNVLPSLLFNPHNRKKEFNNTNLYTKHIGTVSWGK